MRLLWCAVLMLVIGQGVSRGEDSPATSKLTSAEQELVTQMTSYYEALNEYWTAQRAFETPKAAAKARDEGQLIDPNAEFIPKLLSFEESHRGDDVGLLALRRIFLEAARGGSYDSPANVGRREAAKRLHNYANSELLTAVAGGSLKGYPERESFHAVSELVASPVLSKRSRDTLRYLLAIESLELKGWRDGAVKRLESLRASDKPRWPGQLESEEKWFNAWPSSTDWNANYDAAIQTLEELAADKESHRTHSYEGIDDRWYVIRTADDSQQPLLAEVAAASLFRAQNLKIGKVIPDFDVKLLNDTTWRMADQYGKVVIIQFSFTGCGPCEEMYPDLKDLAAEHGERVAILTILRDETEASATEGVASGKLTWNIAVDGNPGDLTSQWSVTAFPDVYVIEQNGEIAAIGPRGDDLRKLVALLLDDES